MNQDILREKIIENFEKCEGAFAMAFKILDTNSDPILINSDEVFHAASTMKTAVMLQIFKMIDEKKLKYNDKVLIKNKFKSIVDSSEYTLSIEDDSDDVLYKKIGQYATIKELTYLMMTVSSNLATNILIEICGPNNIMKTLGELQINGIHVMRGVEDNLAFKAGLNNTTTALGMMKLFERIEAIPNISHKSKIMEILFAQKFKEIIPAQLPSTVKVAHKTGSITGVQHDTGIVYLPNGKKYVLILLSKNLKNVEEGIKTMAEVSKMVYDFMAD